MNTLKRCVALSLLLATALVSSEELCSLDHAAISIYVVQTDTGKVLIDKNSDMSMVPSSCMKVVTTAAALHLLGAERRFETHLTYDGVINKTRTLHGNLYIQGGEILALVQIGFRVLFLGKNKSKRGPMPFKNLEF